MAKFKVIFYRSVTTLDLVEREINARSAEEACEIAETMAEELGRADGDPPETQYNVGDVEASAWTVENVEEA